MHKNVAEPGNPYRAPSKSSCSSLSSRPPVYDAKLQNCLAPRSSSRWPQITPDGPKWHQMASDGPMPPHYPEVTQILVHFLFPGQGDLCGAESSHPAPVHRVRTWAHGAGVANDVIYRQVAVGACRCL